MPQRRWAWIAAGLAATGLVAANGCQVVASLYAPREAHCADGIQNEDETGVDCGDPAKECPACVGGSCKADEDCISLQCAGGKCIAQACNDPSRPCWLCHECGANDNCASPADCQTGFCQEGNCVACKEDTNPCPVGPCIDGNCVAVTCGFDHTCTGTGGMGGTGGTGGTGGSMSASASASSASSASSGGGAGGSGTGGASSSSASSGGGAGGAMSSSGGGPTCSDGTVNGGESDVDCGHVCAPTQLCGTGKHCFNNVDCASMVCLPVAVCL